MRSCTGPARVRGCQARCASSKRRPQTPAPSPAERDPALTYALIPSPQVVSIDLTIQPPSYCIEVDGNQRDTEEWRLKKPEAGGAVLHTPAQLPVQPAAAPAAPAAAASAPAAKPLNPAAAWPFPTGNKP